MSEWRLEALNHSHERGDFQSGQVSLDRFLQTLATQYEKRNLARTVVALDVDQKRVLGYFTLAGGGIAITDLPPTIARKLPDHAIPIILLGRLAVDQRMHGKGLGAYLLRAALQRCRRLSEDVGVFAVTVAALDERARQFYLKYGFQSLQDNPMHLFLRMKDIEAGQT